MPSKTTNDIKNFWKKSSQAVKDKDGLRPTARDPFLQQAVEKIMLEHLQPDMSLLDVGCGDGSSSILFAQKAGYTLGIDYIEEFVQAAQNKAKQKSIKNIEFVCGDVTRLSESIPADMVFDVAISIRCLINLPEWSLQAKGFREIAKQIRPGGIYMCSEGWAEGLNGLNQARQDMNLEPIQASHYNRLISRREFEQHVSKDFNIVSYHGLGLYLFVSRVLHPYIKFPEPPKHTDTLNRIGCDIQNALHLSKKFDDIDFAGVYLLEKK